MKWKGEAPGMCCPPGEPGHISWLLDKDYWTLQTIFDHYTGADSDVYASKPAAQSHIYIYIYIYIYISLI